MRVTKVMKMKIKGPALFVATEKIWSSNRASRIPKRGEKQERKRQNIGEEKLLPSNCKPEKPRPGS